MLTLLPCLALAACAPGALAPAALVADSAVAHVAVADDWTQLVGGYAAAVEAWKQKIEATEDRVARRELRKEHPTLAWWPRFEASGTAGEGRALLWMATHVRDKRVKRAEAVEMKERMFAALAEQHADAEWFGDVLAELPGEREYLSSERYTQVCKAAIERNELADVRAAGMLALGSYLRASEDEAQQAEGLRWLKQVQSEFPGTKWATAALAATIRAEDLQPGKLAPDFVASTIDGHAFKLSDYRGKVVLIDFYGFW